MKKIYSCKPHPFAWLLLLFSASAFGQGYDSTKWRFSNPKPLGFTVFDITYSGNSNVLAVGADGGMARSADGGKTWSYGVFTYTTPSGFQSKASLMDVHYATPTVAYAVGANGQMAKTTDGGLTWSFVTTPLYANSRNINAVWFVNRDTGYIGGQYNTPDSIPKLYITRNGGATWDSLAAPLGGKTRVGYINNPNLPPLIWDVTAKNKEIYRIQFANVNTGYVSGTASGLFPPFPSAAAATCLPTGNTAGTGSGDAPLLWKITNGTTLTDYSFTKERLGYSGVNASTITCTTLYGSITPQAQQYRAMNVVTDSLVVLMSFNNNIVVRVRTGAADSTQNVATGQFERGRYEVTNFPFPPNGAPAIPVNQVLVTTNPYQIKRAANGTLFANGNLGRLYTSVDTGRTWVLGSSLPANKNYSMFAVWALDIAPNGRILSMGQSGVVADSLPGGTWASNYVFVQSGPAEMEFADCNNGIAAGGSAITVTTDGGTTWTDKNRPDFAASFYSINGMSYPSLTKAYFAVSNGVIYFSSDKGTTLDPAYTNIDLQMNDVQAIGNDTVYAVGYSQFAIPAASRKSTFMRSVNNGATWSEVTVSQSTGTFTAPTLSQLSFANRNLGYLAGSRNAIFKTTDGGLTWTDISPFPALNAGPTGFPNAFVTYTEIFALNDTTVFAVGNMFTNVGNRRVYRSTNAGTTWVDITGNIPALGLVGNLNGVLFSDLNNGYVVSPGGVMYRTTDGGTNWTVEIAPTNTLFTCAAFAPRNAPASVPFANRKVFVSGFGVASSAPTIMEYGNRNLVNVNATSTVVNTTCTAASGGSITVNATGGIAPYQYSINGTTFQSGNVFSGLTQGARTITVRDAYCGLTTLNVTVGFTDNQTLTTNNDTTVCAGAPVQLNAAAATGSTYAWTPATGLSATNIANPIATPQTTTTYTVTATLGTCVRTKNIVIGIKASPAVSAGADKTIVAGDGVQLDGSASNVLSVAWTPAATLTNANTLTPIAKPTATTTYTLTVRNTDNCTSTDDVVVNVIPVCVQVMNAFTPNGDGTNDRWRVTNGAACTNSIQVAVYNRYGREVYKNNAYNNDWDGTYNGKPLPDGTYYYRVTFRLINGSTVSQSGDVTILR